jgi:hypothetical protein
MADTAAEPKTPTETSVRWRDCGPLSSSGGLVLLIEQGTGVMQERHARVGQRHPAPVTGENAPGQRRPQCRRLLGHCAGRKAQSIRSFGPSPAPCPTRCPLSMCSDSTWAGRKKTPPSSLMRSGTAGSRPVCPGPGRTALRPAGRHGLRCCGSGRGCSPKPEYRPQGMACFHSRVRGRGTGRSSAPH